MCRVLGPLLRASLIAAPLLLSLAPSGCASALPPAVPVQDLKAIAGRWQGTWNSPQGSFHEDWTIKEAGTEGTYEGTRAAPPVGGKADFEGLLRVRDGKIVWLSRTTGRSGTMTLHEAEGRRVLSGQSDDGSNTFRLTSVP